MGQLAAKDAIIDKHRSKIMQLEQEIERRKFIEAKVQTYVKSLCLQN